MKKKPNQSPKFSPVHPSLSDWTIALLNQVSERSQILFDYHLGRSSTNINTHHYVILFVLAHQGPHSQSKLAQILRVDRSLMVQLIDYLEQQHWVERAPNPRDRRSYAVTLTETGQLFLNQATELAKTVETEVLAPLSLEERNQLHQLLARLLK